jgi:hypothetical protein
MTQTQSPSRGRLFINGQWVAPRDLADPVTVVNAADGSVLASVVQGPVVHGSLCSRRSSEAATVWTSSVG